MPQMHRPAIGVTSGLIGTDRERIRVPLQYLEAVILGGGLPLLMPVTERLEIVPGLIDRIDGLLITGGPDIDPARYGRPQHPKTVLTDARRTAIELALLAEAERRGLPVLGICGGIQLMNIARGGTLIQHLDNAERHSSPDGQADAEHDIVVEPGTRLAGVVGEGALHVNSAHHQASDDVGRGLVVTARAFDGTIEGLEDPARAFHIGVQWHPERIIDAPHSRALFRSFCDSCTR